MIFNEYERAAEIDEKQKFLDGQEFFGKKFILQEVAK